MRVWNEWRECNSPKRGTEDRVGDARRSAKLVQCASDLTKVESV